VVGILVKLIFFRFEMKISDLKCNLHCFGGFHVKKL
jgi:hypothetical protein